MARAEADEKEPVFGPLLSFLAQDIARHPERLQPFSPDMVQRVHEPTKEVVYDVDAPLSPDD
jgi:antitoxin PrlF